MSVPHGSCPCQCHGQNQLDRTCNIEGGCYGFHEEPSSPMPSQTTNGNIGPCVFPGCLDVDDNPRLTTRVVCTPCRHRYARIIDRIVWNYVLLRHTMPKPQGSNTGLPVTYQSREYGHPAEAASDVARNVADQLNEAHDGLADHRGDEPPPHPGSREAGRVAAAHHYLTSWPDDLCTYPAAADTAESVGDLDRELRRILGKTDPRAFLPVPCPACNQLGLVRTGSQEDFIDEVQCYFPGCGERILPGRYSWWTRRLIHQLAREI